MKAIDHPEFQPGDEVERIVPVAPHPNTRYNKNKGVVVSVYAAPISGLLVSVRHGDQKSSGYYSLSLWRKIQPTK